MKTFLHFLVHRPSTPHIVLLHLTWMFAMTFIIWQDGCLWGNPPYC